MLDVSREPSEIRKATEEVVSQLTVDSSARILQDLTQTPDNMGTFWPLKMVGYFEIFFGVKQSGSAS